MKQYVECVIDNLTSDREIVLARLSELTVDSIWEDEDIKIYIDTDRSDELLGQLTGLADELSFTFHCHLLENRNWNAIWESDFNAVEVDQFVRIRALFHEVKEGFDHELVIHPKMAFGTGHHATTWMMVKQMSAINFEDKKVWDFGTGTGVLAILATKLGASEVEANDIEAIAIENAIENQALNHAPNISFKVGGLEETSKGPFDVILANINRNVLVASMPEIYRRMDRRGTLVLSGILNDDKSMMLASLEAQGFADVTTYQKGEWLCMVCQQAAH